MGVRPRLRTTLGHLQQVRPYFSWERYLIRVKEEDVARIDQDEAFSRRGEGALAAATFTFKHVI